MRRVLLILGLCGMICNASLLWAQTVITKRFQVELPDKTWQLQDNLDELKLQATTRTEMYLKKTNGSLVLIRSGLKEDFGVSPYFDFSSDDSEIVYLMKFVSGGDYDQEIKLKSENKLLSHAKAYLFKVDRPIWGPAKDLAVMLTGQDTILIEFLASPNNFDHDLAQFYKILDKLQEK
jgi:serine/threonine protein kinase